MTSPIPFVSQLDAAEEQEWFELLSGYLPDEDIVQFSQLSDAQKNQASVAIVANPNPADIGELPNLVWVHSVWAGVERLVGDLADRTFDIVRLVDPKLSCSMAEAVLAWSLYLHRDMPGYARQQQKKEWKERPFYNVSDRTIGILGLGELGRASAKLLSDVGFNVLGWSRSQKNIKNVVTRSGSAGLDEVLSQSDIVVSLLPLTEQTRGLINKDVLAKLPEQAGLINFGRGPVVDIQDLVDALDAEHIRHAVLDVFEQEPLPEESALWDHQGITVLPHISAPTNMTTASKIVSQNIRLYRQNGTLPETVDRKRGY